MVVMVDCVREMTAEKSCKNGEMDHFGLLVLFFAVFFLLHTVISLFRSV